MIFYIQVVQANATNERHAGSWFCFFEEKWTGFFLAVVKETYVIIRDAWLSWYFIFISLFGEGWCPLGLYKVENRI